MKKTVCVAALILALVLFFNACAPIASSLSPVIEISQTEAVVKVGESIKLSASSSTARRSFGPRETKA